MGKKYYRANEVAKYIGVGVATIWRYAQQGRLTPIKVSPQVTVFDIDEINSLLSEKGGE